MANFNDFRNKWFYQCMSCKKQVTAYRNCGEVSICSCGKPMQLIGTQEGEKTPDVAAKLYIKTFRPYFDVTLGHEVTSEREIKEYCAKNDCVYAGDKELTQQCEQNKAENEKRMMDSFEKGLTNEIMEHIN